MKITYIAKYFYPSKKEESIFITQVRKQFVSMAADLLSQIKENKMSDRSVSLAKEWKKENS